MSDKHVSHDGTVYTDIAIMHPNTRDCSHEVPNVCAFCDFDRYYAARHRDVCPWAGGMSE